MLVLAKCPLFVVLLLALIVLLQYAVPTSLIAFLLGAVVGALLFLCGAVLLLRRSPFLYACVIYPLRLVVRLNL